MTDIAKEARDARIVEFVTNWKAFIETPDGVAFYRIVDAARAEGVREGMAKAAEIARAVSANIDPTREHIHHEAVTAKIAEAILAAAPHP